MEVRRLAILVGVVVVVLAGGIWLLFLRGGDDAPTTEAGSRFGQDSGSGSGGTLIDTLAPLLTDRTRAAPTGSDPSPPTPAQVEQAPEAAVAGLFMVGFKGTNSEASFFKRMKVVPYGGVVLTSANYTGRPAQISGLTLALQRTARKAGHPAPIIAAPQEGGDFSAFQNLAPPSQVDVGNARKGTRAAALAAGRQLRALGVNMTLAPYAGIGVAGGPGQGRAFSDQVSRVTSAVKASVSAYRQSKVVSSPSPFPGDGAASQDPSEGPAPVGLSLDELRNADMKPFEAIASGDRAVPAIQMSNAIYAAYDGVTPATLLPEAVDELRNRLDFEGAIVSADLVVTTATTGGSVGEAAIDALQAGVDLLVVPGGRAQQDEAFRAVVAAVRAKTLDADRVADALGHIADVRALTKDSRDPQLPGE